MRGRLVARGVEGEERRGTLKGVILHLGGENENWGKKEKGVGKKELLFLCRGLKSRDAKKGDHRWNARVHFKNRKAGNERDLTEARGMKGGKGRGEKKGRASNRTGEQIFVRVHRQRTRTMKEKK